MYSAPFLQLFATRGWLSQKPQLFLWLLVDVVAQCVGFGFELRLIMWCTQSYVFSFPPGCFPCTQRIFTSWIRWNTILHLFFTSKNKKENFVFDEPVQLQKSSLKQPCELTNWLEAIRYVLSSLVLQYNENATADTRNGGIISMGYTIRFANRQFISTCLPNHANN